MKLSSIEKSKKRWYSHTAKYRKYNNDRQIRRQRLLVESGLCCICGKARLTERSKSRCELCLAKQKIAQKKYALKNNALVDEVIPKKPLDIGL